MTKKSTWARGGGIVIAAVTAIVLMAPGASAEEDRSHAGPFGCTSSTGWQIRLSSTSKGVAYHKLESPNKSWYKGNTTDYASFGTGTATQTAAKARNWAYDYIQTGPNGPFVQTIGRLSASSAWCGV